MGVGIYYFYHWFGLEAFEGRHIRINNNNLFLFINLLVYKNDNQTSIRNLCNFLVRKNKSV